MKISTEQDILSALESDVSILDRMFSTYTDKYAYHVHDRKPIDRIDCMDIAIELEEFFGNTSDWHSIANYKKLELLRQTSYDCQTRNSAYIEHLESLISQY